MPLRTEPASGRSDPRAARGHVSPSCPSPWGSSGASRSRSADSASRPDTGSSPVALPTPPRLLAGNEYRRATRRSTCTPRGSDLASVTSFVALASTAANRWGRSRGPGVRRPGHGLGHGGLLPLECRSGGPRDGPEHGPRHRSRRLLPTFPSVPSSRACVLDLPLGPTTGRT